MQGGMAVYLETVHLTRRKSSNSK